MRRVTLVAPLLALLTFAVGGVAVIACGSGGNGIGTAPPLPAACPDPTKSGPPAAEQPCGVTPQICTGYPNGVVAYCPGGTAAKWRHESPTDGGGLADGDPIVRPDTADAAVDGDVLEGETAETSTDDADALADGDTLPDGDASTSDSAPADGPADTAPTDASGSDTAAESSTDTAVSPG